MTYILILVTILCSAIIDCIMAHDTFSKHGLYFSRDGWKVKYQLTEWFNKFLPLGISKFLAQDVFVIFTDLFHTAKTIMIASFMVIVFGLTIKAFLAWIIWGFIFNFFYYFLK